MLLGVLPLLLPLSLPLAIVIPIASVGGFDFLVLLEVAKRLAAALSLSILSRGDITTPLLLPFLVLSLSFLAAAVTLSGAVVSNETRETAEAGLSRSVKETGLERSASRGLGLPVGEVEEVGDSR
jgi:hypothetical protein